jgi:exoribonuclease-2
VRISGPTTEGKVVDGFEGLDVGDRVRVELVRTDIERGFIDFAAVHA